LAKALENRVQEIEAIMDEYKAIIDEEEKQ